jgi:hypothetical protein
MPGALPEVEDPATGIRLRPPSDLHHPGDHRPPLDALEMGQILAFQLRLDRVKDGGALVIVDKQIAFAVQPPRAFDRKGFKGFGPPGFDQGGGVLDQPDELLVVLVQISVEPLRRTAEDRHADEQQLQRQHKETDSLAPCSWG